MARRPRITIIGEGIGGLAAARALMLRGIEAAVYEQAPRLSEFGGGVVMTPNAMKALRSLGIEDAVLAHAFAPSVQVARSWRSGRGIDRAPLDVYRDHFGARFCTMHRGDLQHVLRDVVGDDHIRLGTRCVGISSDGPSARARFEDGREIGADAVTGADGIHSVVRTCLFGEESPRFTGNVCWRGLVQARRLPLGWHRRSSRFGGVRMATSSITTSGAANCSIWVAITEIEEWTEESWCREGDPDEVKRTYAGWNQRLLDLFDASEGLLQMGALRSGAGPQLGASS